MIRSELIQKISEENPHLFQRDVERIVNTVFEEIIDAGSAKRVSRPAPLAVKPTTT